MTKRKVETRPSASAQWSNCEGSAYLSTLVPEEETNEAAKRGDKLHAEAFSISEGKPGDYDEDALELVSIASAVIYDFIEQAGGVDVQEIKEERLELPGYELVAGTGDWIVICGDKGLVIDYKTGRVEVENSVLNTQMRIYAGLTAVKFPQLREVHAVIVQPSKGWIPAPFVFERTSLIESLDILNEIAKKLHAHDGEEELEFAVGDHCGYCKAKGICRSYMKHLGLNELVAVNQAAKPMEVMSDEELVAIFKAKALINKVVKYMDSVKAELANRLTERAVDGVEWGRGRGSRVWADALTAADALEKLELNPWKTEIISPHAAELQLRDLKKPKKTIAPLIVSIAGGQALKLSAGDEDGED